MAQEATIRSSLQVRKGNTFYLSQPTQFLADQNGSGGPVPGQLLIGVGGSHVNFSPLIQPSLCRIQNLDSVHYVTVGIWDGDTSKFHPMIELLPGETFVMRISRKLKTLYPGTGTGSAGAPMSLHIRAADAPCQVLVEAFEY